jgi:Domain of unknown function (DUF5615)
MLRLLLDEHISPDVAKALRRIGKNMVVYCLPEWNNGHLPGVTDSILLDEAARQNLTLVTYDRRTISPLLKTWAETDRDHGGVVFIDEKTIPPSDIGGLARSLRQLHQETVGWDWRNRIVFLRR